MDKVFISYVRENIEMVKRLYQELKSHGIQVWLDRNDIDPGSRWKREIRWAIQQGAFFIACFSEEYNERNKTYMNEELTIAIEELRQRPVDQAWFIPVKLNECEIPDLDIGRGETLRDLQYVNLYEDWDVNLQRILNIVQPASSEPVKSVSNAEQYEVETQPQNVNAYFDRGNVYQSKGDYDHAIEAFNRAIDLKPDFAEAYTNRGLAYQNKGDYDHAIEDHNTAIDLNPNYAEAYFNRGGAYKGKDNWDYALANFTKAIDLKPDFAGAYNHRGVVYLDKGDYNSAIADFTKAIDLNPEFLDEVYYNRGLAYHKKGEIGKALEDYTKTIELKPRFVDEVYYNRGRVWLHLREWEKAKSDLTAAKDKEMDIITAFTNDYTSVPDFEQRNGVKLPEDLTAMLTPQGAAIGEEAEREATHESANDFETVLDDIVRKYDKAWKTLAKP